MSETPTTPIPTLAEAPSVPTVPYSDLGAAASSLCQAQLGAFDVEEVVGKGGMGVVFSATHAPTRTPVAIKVITRKGAEHPFIAQSLRNEVQAVATLNHPGIVRVLDYGSIGEEAELLTNGEFKSGSPFFVMEYLPDGSLSKLCGKVTWKQAKAIILTLLDALAHAHAMDVIHRDIKPGNILLAGFSGRIIPKLADFGLAFATEKSHDTSRAIGTPQYMAPEQMQQPWRNHGPWSDLYSLGCVAFELVTGKRAFGGKSVIEIYQAHQDGARKSLRSLLRIPDGFEAWLDRMMAVQPSERFQSAADAFRAFLTLDDVDIPEIRPPDATDLAIGGVTPVLDVYRAQAPADGDFKRVFSAVAPLPDTVVENIPDRWEMPRLDGTPMNLVGAGLGLFGLRTVPIVGRRDELEAAWQTLRHVHQTTSPSVVVVRGTEGTGKTRLGDGFVQRVEELGVAHVLRATHSPEPNSANGIARMLARHFRTLGATRIEASGIVREDMRDLGVEELVEWQAIGTLVAEGMDLDDDEGGGFEFASPKQRHAALTRYLGHLGETGPIVLWMDDCQWGTDTLEFVHHLTQSEKSIPILVILSVTDETIAREKEPRELLDAVLQSDAASEFNLAPLSDTEHEDLIRALANLEADLALELGHRTAGNPRLAVELIGDWVARGVLEVGETGFVLRPGEKAVIPDNLHQVWDTRIQDVVSSFGADARIALELAAALGHEVDQSEWQMMCRLARIELAPSLPAVLAERRFARRTDTGWAFAHSILRESLQREAENQGRWLEHLKRCAYLVEMQYDVKRPSNAERYGRYLVGAGEFEKALKPLFRGARGRRQQGEFRSAHQLISKYLRALEEAHIPEDDYRWGLGWTLRAQIYINSQQPQSAKRWAERAAEQARLHDWPDIDVKATTWLALAEAWMGLPEANETMSRVLEMLESNPEDADFDSYGILARLLTSKRRFDDARQVLEQGRSVATESRHIALIYQQRCRLAIFEQDWEVAFKWGEKALKGFEALGHFPAMANVMEYLAEVHKRLGQIEEATKLYQECIALQESIGYPTVISELNLASILLKAGSYQDAETLYMVATDKLRSLGRRRLEMAAMAGILASAAGMGSWKTVEEVAKTLASYMDEAMDLEPEIATLLETGGLLLLEKDRPLIAEEVLLLAARQFEHNGNKEKAQSLREKAADLDFFP